MTMPGPAKIGVALDHFYSRRRDEYNRSFAKASGLILPLALKEYFDEEQFAKLHSACNEQFPDLWGLVEASIDSHTDADGKVSYCLKDSIRSTTFQVVGIDSLQTALEQQTRDNQFEQTLWSIARHRSIPKSLYSTTTYSTTARAADILRPLFPTLPITTFIQLVYECQTFREWSRESTRIDHVNRSKAIETLAAFLNPTDHAPVIQVVGGPGYGKSTLIRFVLSRLEARRQIDFCYVDFERPISKANIYEYILQECLVQFYSRDLTDGVWEKKTLDVLRIRTDATTKTAEDLIDGLKGLLNCIDNGSTRSKVIALDSLEMFAGEHSGLEQIRSLLSLALQELPEIKWVIGTRERVVFNRDEVDTLNLANFGRIDAQELLLTRGVDPRHAILLLGFMPLQKRGGGFNPLLLVIFGEYLKQKKYAKLQELAVGTREEYHELAFHSYIYDRILVKVRDPVLREIAEYCLALRRLSAGILSEFVLPRMRSKGKGGLGSYRTLDAAKVLARIPHQIFMTRLENQEVTLREDIRSVIVKTQANRFRPIWKDFIEYSGTHKDATDELKLDCLFASCASDPDDPSALDRVWSCELGEKLKPYVFMMSRRVSAWYRLRRGEPWSLEDVEYSYEFNFRERLLPEAERHGDSNRNREFKNALERRQEYGRVFEEGVNIVTAMRSNFEGKYAESHKLLQRVRGPTPADDPRESAQLAIYRVYWNEKARVALGLRSGSFDGKLLGAAKALFEPFASAGDVCSVSDGMRLAVAAALISGRWEPTKNCNASALDGLAVADWRRLSVFHSVLLDEFFMCGICREVELVPLWLLHCSYSDWGTVRLKDYSALLEGVYSRIGRNTDARRVIGEMARAAKERDKVKLARTLRYARAELCTLRTPPEVAALVRKFIFQYYRGPERQIASTLLRNMNSGEVSASRISAILSQGFGVSRGSNAVAQNVVRLLREDSGHSIAQVIERLSTAGVRIGTTMSRHIDNEMKFWRGSLS